MNVNDAFPSDFLKADDLKGKTITVTIAKVTIEEIGQGNQKERKLVLAFVGKDKRLVLNKTNAGTISKLYGGETDDWLMKSITLQPREVEYQGDMVWAIRVSLQKPGASSQPVVEDAKPVAAAYVPKGDLADEDVPF